jgi:hypothetical protein
MPVYRKRKLLQPGEYDVEIGRAGETVSSTANEMLVVHVCVRSEEWPRITIRDYLVFSDNSLWKFESFLQSIGLHLEDGQAFETSDFIGCTARVRVGIRKFGDREQNYIERWLPNAVNAPSPGSGVVTNNPSVTQTSE